jgi:hypothetical protein
MSPGRAQQRQVKHLCTKTVERDAPGARRPNALGVLGSSAHRTADANPGDAAAIGLSDRVVNRAAEDCLVETHLGLRGTGIPSVPVGPRWGRADQRPAPAPIGLGVRVSGLRRLALPPRESRYDRGTPDGRYDLCRLRGATQRGMDNILRAWVASIARRPNKPAKNVCKHRTPSGEDSAAQRDIVARSRATPQTAAFSAEIARKMPRPQPWNDGEPVETPDRPDDQIAIRSP